MSQSDYIKYKRVSTELLIDNKITNNKLSPVLSSQNYIDFSQYTIINITPNDTPTFNTVNLLGTQEIFGMNKIVSNCPTFLICNKTNTRPNRLLLSSIYSNPTPQPKTIKDTKNKVNAKTECSCVMNSKNTEKNICKCKRGAWGIVR